MDDLDFSRMFEAPWEKEGRLLAAFNQAVSVFNRTFEIHGHDIDGAEPIMNSARDVVAQAEELQELDLREDVAAHVSARTREIKRVLEGLEKEDPRVRRFNIAIHNFSVAVDFPLSTMEDLEQRQRDVDDVYRVLKTVELDQHTAEFVMRQVEMVHRTMTGFSGKPNNRHGYVQKPGSFPYWRAI